MAENTVRYTGTRHGQPAGQQEVLPADAASAKDEAVRTSYGALQSLATRSSGMSTKDIPSLLRATSTAVMSARGTAPSTAATPLLSRPVLNRTPASVDATYALRNTSNSARPSLLRRATDVVTSPFTSKSPSMAIVDDKASRPTYWADHVHRKPLLEVWDSIEQSRKQDSVAVHLSQAHRQMLKCFAELAAGEEPLTTEWIELVLGDCLRHPFSTTTNTGIWQRLAVAAGPRGNWGPW